MAIGYVILLTLVNIFIGYKSNQDNRDYYERNLPSTIPPPIQISMKITPLSMEPLHSKPCTSFSPTKITRDMKSGIVYVYKGYTGAIICIGALVHEMVVLVTSECVEHLNASEIFVRSQFSYNGITFVTVNATETSIPSHIAVLFLNKPINGTVVRVPKPAALQEVCYNGVYGSNITIVFGQTLREKNLTVIHREECKTYNRNRHFFVSIFKFCTIDASNGKSFMISFEYIMLL